MAVSQPGGTAESASVLASQSSPAGPAWWLSAARVPARRAAPTFRPVVVTVLTPGNVAQIAAVAS
jgi:hypothetical protein